MTSFDKVIPPGSEGKVNASVNLSHAKGPFEKYVDIKTNDPGRSTARLVVKANVKTYVDVMPAEFVRFNMSKGESVTQVLTLSPSEGQSITFREPTVDSEYFTVKMEALPAANSSATKQYKLTVAPKESIKIGTQRANIKIATDGAPIKEITIPVFAQVKGPIFAVPATVSFSLNNFPSEVTVSGRIHLRQQPDVSSQSLEMIAPGSKLRVIAEQGDWYRVIPPNPTKSTNNPIAGAGAGSPQLEIVNKTGWVNKKVVKVTRGPEKDTVQPLSIEHANGRAFKVLDYSSDLAEIKLEMDPENGGGKKYKLQVSLVKEQNARGKKVHSGSITIKTDDPEQPEVKVPIYIVYS